MTELDEMRQALRAKDTLVGFLMKLLKDVGAETDQLRERVDHSVLMASMYRKNLSAISQHFRKIYDFGSGTHSRRLF